MGEKGNHGGVVVAMRLMLLKDYINRNASPTRIVKRQDLENHLAANGYDVERKSIYRYIEALQDYCGMDLVYTRRGNGWLLMNPTFETYELRLMADSIQASKFITKDISKTIVGKIQKLTDVETQAALNREIEVEGRVRSMNDSVVKDADKIHQAIKENRKIGFRFFHYKPDRNKTRTYSKAGEMLVVSPYALQWHNGNYYLYAYDGKIFRHYRVDRMDRISDPLTEKREGRELYDEQQKKERRNQKPKVFDMYHGEEYTVNIRFINKLADMVIDQFGKDVLMIPVDDGHFTINVPIEVSPTFYAWIATFGRRVKILGPAPVVDGMREFLERSMSMYKEEEK